ncbi:MAG: histidinol-phosphate transaminase [Eubacteriales bacterium]|nr:histidinol-phosphate transaminase [Eubacteriales bacterium]
MQNYLSDKAAGLKPYTAGEQPKAKNIIKLNTNENPYPPSPKTLDAYHHFDASNLRLYPRPDGGELRNTIAKIYDVPASCVFCGNGSDEILGFAFAAFFDGDVMFPDITYSFYPVWAALFGITYSTLALRDDFTIPVDRLCAKGIVLANPNAPTGIAIGQGDIEDVLMRNRDSVVIVDEAYAAFGAQSAACLVPEYPNLVVVNTLSKSHALAGMRIGYALAQPHLIDGLMRIKNSFNSYPLDAVAQCVGSAALMDSDYYTDVAKKIAATRDRVAAQLKILGFTVLPSCANFLFVTKQGMSAAALKNHLELGDIYVRHWDNPRISEFLRISIGTDRQMDTLIQKIKGFPG